MAGDRHTPSKGEVGEPNLSLDFLLDQTLNSLLENRQFKTTKELHLALTDNAYFTSERPTIILDMKNPGASEAEVRKLTREININGNDTRVEFTIRDYARTGHEAKVLEEVKELG
ncbi:hypothetical protein KJ903_02125 [Patescibacteria group bacterium]|nr:hypothetical protein [Patescibacteria group bacterium]